MADQAILFFMGTGYFSLTFCFIDKAIHINVLLMFSLCLHPYFPLSKSHKSFRQSLEGLNTW